MISAYCPTMSHLMRERRNSDWIIDLNGRHDLESHVARRLAAHPRLSLLTTSTSSFNRLDYQLIGPGERLIELELKAKHQPLSEGWKRLRPDVDASDLFVLDELAVRKIVDAGRYAFLLIRDVPRDLWHLFSAGDLVVASRVRHTRRLEKGQVPAYKGKLVFNLSEAGHHSRELDVALEAIASTATELEARWTDISPWTSLAVRS